VQGDDPLRESLRGQGIAGADHKCHTVPHIGSLKLTRLSGAAIGALYAKLAMEGKRDGRKGLSPLSVRHVHATPHRALKDAARWGRDLRGMPPDVGLGERVGHDMLLRWPPPSLSARRSFRAAPAVADEALWGLQPRRVPIAHGFRSGRADIAKYAR
jgi:hypothetical protein